MSSHFQLDFETLAKVQTWRDFDEHFTKKLFLPHQHTTIADYYQASSALNKIQNVKKPTLVIHSKDDPIVPIECLPVTECLANPKIIVRIVEKGGHVCYFQGVKG